MAQDVRLPGAEAAEFAEYCPAAAPVGRADAVFISVVDAA